MPIDTNAREAQLLRLNGQMRLLVFHELFVKEFVFCICRSCTRRRPLTTNSPMAAVAPSSAGTGSPMSTAWSTPSAQLSTT